MAIEEIRTFKDIQDAIIRRAKLRDTTEIRTDLKEKINTAYRKLSFQKFYKWSGKTRMINLKGKYATGTLTVTNGSNAITGDSTVWTSLLHLGWKIKIGARPNPYTIVKVTSNTAATISPAYDGENASSLAYILYKDEYGLYPDLHEIRKFYIPGSISRVSPEGPDFIDERRFTRPFFGGLPRHYTVNGRTVFHEKTWATFLLNFDFFEDPVTIALPKNENLVIYPAIFTNDRIGYVRYTVIPRGLSADSDEPLMPIANRPILVYKPLVESFLQRRDVPTKREWEAEHRSYEKDMEGDVESVDDELRFIVDRRGNRRSTYGYSFDDGLFND